MVRIHIIPRVKDLLDYDSWIDAIDAVTMIVTSYLLGEREIAMNIPTNPKTLKRTLKMLKLLGFRIEIRKRKGCYYHQYSVVIREVKEPRKGLEYLIRFAPTIEVKVWLKLLLKLLTKQKDVIPPCDASIFRRFTDWWWRILKLEEKGLLQIDRKLLYCDDDMQECEYDYTIHVNP